MNFLFIHQNFPAQFRHLANALLEDPKNKVYAIGETNNVRTRGIIHKRIILLGYQLELSKLFHQSVLGDFEIAAQRGQLVAGIALRLKNKGFYPDIIIAHPGWGETLFLKDIFPKSKHIYYFEFYYHAYGHDVGFDPEFPISTNERLLVRLKNTTQLLSLESADEGIAPTHWQKQQYPVEFHSKIKVFHEGINTRLAAPNPEACFSYQNKTLTRDNEIITYVARNLEPYRGFHCLMRALPAILEARPQAQILIVGGDAVSYGRRLPNGQNYRELYLKELGHQLDLSRIHFVGKVSYRDFLTILQVSSVHVYLTYPFVLSWSMLEAMSVGCALVASETAPVKEVVLDGINGQLVDFFNMRQLADTVIAVLQNPDDYREMRFKARQTIIDHYDLEQVCLPDWVRFVLHSRKE
ncbi:glycosyltransferase family 4 protein [Methylotuvimicrobium buryatense]|uniref:Glycosyltransferase n=1 Tax=Methylotuvimicrobium buryatense TaxID=95641 RepID=A0A4V1IKB2_METBY|nr:glycosyltransferase family 4 protein [Methylotuvimicrobium buryatense]QCW84295.1 glycosyltransferase [Methylotuvimicrobium buryatense]